MTFYGTPAEDIESCNECGEQRVIGDDFLNDDGVCDACAMNIDDIVIAVAVACFAAGWFIVYGGF